MQNNQLIAFCGLNCATCEGYIATQNNDQKALEEVAKMWSEQFGADIRPEHVICDGCRTNKRKSFHCENTCTIKPCNIEKKYNSCLQCSTFPCEEEKFILEHVPEAKKNLESLK